MLCIGLELPSYLSANQEPASVTSYHLSLDRKLLANTLVLTPVQAATVAHCP